MRTTRLVPAAHVSLTSTLRWLDRLAEAGLIERRPDPTQAARPARVYHLLHFACYTDTKWYMPSADPDDQLLRAVSALVKNCKSQAEAARRLGMPRLRISRLLKQEGRLTERVRAEFWNALDEVQGPAGPTPHRSEPIQVIRDVPAVAMQVIQFMAKAVEREGLRSARRSSDGADS
jgi:hypothetical protein